MTIAALKALCSRIPWCGPAVLESVLELALEMSWTHGISAQVASPLVGGREQSRVARPLRHVSVGSVATRHGKTRSSAAQGKGGKAWHRVR